VKIHPYGDNALFVDLEIDDAPDRPKRTQAIGRQLRRRLPSADVVIGAGSLAIVGVGAWDDLDGIIADALRQGVTDDFAPKLHVLRAIYDGADLEDVARRTGLPSAEVVALHAARDYQVELIGFLPGFAYLASLDARLVTPRRAAPRPRVPKGSLAIAGSYTGVYSVASPGGWHLIGRVLDVELFDPERRPPALFEPGDQVRFVPYRPD
jgi:KipI family sensor histidine kinase inhibitor